jgi:hypothetical protein
MSGLAMIAFSRFLALFPFIAFWCWIDVNFGLSRERESVADPSAFRSVATVSIASHSSSF